MLNILMIILFIGLWCATALKIVEGLMPLIQEQDPNFIETSVLVLLVIFGTPFMLIGEAFQIAIETILPGGFDDDEKEN